MPKVRPEAAPETGVLLDPAYVLAFRWLPEDTPRHQEQGLQAYKHIPARRAGQQRRAQRESSFSCCVPAMSKPAKGGKKGGTHNLIVVGAGGVGKSALTLQFMYVACFCSRGLVAPSIDLAPQVWQLCRGVRYVFWIRAPPRTSISSLVVISFDLLIQILPRPTRTARRSRCLARRFSSTS
jgi:hypothetical protein